MVLRKPSKKLSWGVALIAAACWIPGCVDPPPAPNTPDPTPVPNDPGPSPSPDPTPTPSPDPDPTPPPAPDPTPGPEEDFALGWAPPDPAVVASRPQAINPYGASANAPLPNAVDLTAWLPPIGDQGQQSSCVAFAAGYAGASYAANRQYDWGAAAAGHQASPGYLYAALLETDQLPCGSGTFVDTAINLLIRDGCASYAAVGYSDSECFANPPIADGANFRIGSYNRVEPGDRDAVRAELAAGRIVVIGAELYTDFMDYRGDGVFVGNGVYLMAGAQHAGHALAVVGYDDDRGAYRIMNSWSEIWGDQGFMWMDYQTFEATVREAYSLEPRGDHEPPVEPGDDDVQPEPTEEPQGYLDDAYQFADVGYDGQALVYLVFNWHFSAPVFIREITVTDPAGGMGTQAYNTWFIDGYVYFVQTGGFQWQSGAYLLEFDTQTASGANIQYAGEAYIAPLGGEEASGLCTNTCFFAFDGVCDDGGAGSAFSDCAYGTDCADCGARSSDIVYYCDDSCPYAYDFVCDDGGPGASYAACALGSDCFDCGVREASARAAPKVAGRAERTFRGVPRQSRAEEAALPAAGVRPGVQGANRQPARVEANLKNP